MTKFIGSEGEQSTILTLFDPKNPNYESIKKVVSGETDFESLPPAVIALLAIQLYKGFSQSSKAIESGSKSKLMFEMQTFTQAAIYQIFQRSSV